MAQDELHWDQHPYGQTLRGACSSSSPRCGHQEHGAERGHLLGRTHCPLNAACC